MDKRKKIEVNASSLVGLKAELLRKQDEFQKEKLGRSSTSVKPATSSKQTGSIWNKKKKHQRSGPHVRKDFEELQKERDEMDKSRSMLEAKAKLYEQMTSGNNIPDEDTNNLFLVDFEKKQVDKIMKNRNGKSEAGQIPSSDDEEDILAPESEIPVSSHPEEEWVDYTDSLGRSRRCMKEDLPRLIKMDKDLNPEKFREESTEEDATPEMMSSDMHRERMRKKWEKEQEELVDRGQSSIHYQNVRFDEVRSHGAGYFDFAKDETTRDEQLKTLNYLRDETVDRRSKKEDWKAKRKAALEARLEKVRQRKKIKVGETEEKEGSKQKLETEKKVEKEESVDPNWQRTLRLVEAAKKESSKEDRDWDVNKVPKVWAEQRAKMKNERLAEFAPPTDYTLSSAKQKRKFNKTWKENVKGFGQIDSQETMSYGQASLGQRSFVDADHLQSENTSDTSGKSELTHIFRNQFEASRDYGHVSASNSNIDSAIHHEDERLRSSTSGKGSSIDGLKHHSLSSISDSNAGDERTVSKDDLGQRSGQSSGQTVTNDTSKSASKLTPLLRTETSKPIKFSIGFGAKKHELPSATNILDTEDEIKKTISFFRNQAS